MNRGGTTDVSCESGVGGGHLAAGDAECLQYRSSAQERLVPAPNAVLPMQRNLSP